jgi:hypothetical protein
LSDHDANVHHFEGFGIHQGVVGLEYTSAMEAFDATIRSDSLDDFVLDVQADQPEREWHRHGVFSKTYRILGS